MYVNKTVSHLIVWFSMKQYKIVHLFAKRVKYVQMANVYAMHLNVWKRLQLAAYMTVMLILKNVKTEFVFKFNNNAIHVKLSSMDNVNSNVPVLKFVWIISVKKKEIVALVKFWTVKLINVHSSVHTHNCVLVTNVKIKILAHLAKLWTPKTHVMIFVPLLKFVWITTVLHKEIVIPVTR